MTGGVPHTLMLAFVEWPVMPITHVLQPVSLPMEQATRVGELEDTRKGMVHNLVEQLIRAMFVDYQ